MNIGLIAHDGKKTLMQNFCIAYRGILSKHNDIDALIFLRDPMAKPHEPEVNGVIKLCDMHNIPMATNLATAELIILSIDRGDLDWREMYR